MKIILFLSVLFFYVGSLSAQQALTEKQLKKHELPITGSADSILLEKDGCAILLIIPMDENLRITVFRPNHSLVAEYTESNIDAPFPITIYADTAGMFSVSVFPYSSNLPKGKYSIELLSLKNAAACKNLNRQQAIDEPQVVSWIKQNAIPILSLSEEKNFADLHPLKQILKNVTVVALGEQTHGTAEFFQFKERMMKFLVTQMHFKVFTMEEAFTTGLAINQYIQNNKGNIDTLLNAMGQMWNTAEMKETLEWMRAYNSTVDADNKLKFYGFDVLDMHATDSIINYFRTYAPTEFEKVKNYLSDFYTASDSMFLTNAPKYEWIKNYLLTHKQQLVAKCGKENFGHALIETNIFLEQIEMAKAGSQSFFKRDEGMAKKFSDIQANEAPATRMILWAHNGHICIGNEPVLPVMGDILKKQLKNKYYAMALLTGEGDFRAQKLSDNSYTGITDSSGYTNFTLPFAPANYLEHYFSNTNIPSFVIDFRFTKKTPLIENWMNTFSSYRALGRLYNEHENVSFYTDGIILKNDFDGLFFINHSSAAHENK